MFLLITAFFLYLVVDNNCNCSGSVLQAEDLRRQAESLEVAMGQASQDSMQSLRRYSKGGFEVKSNDQEGDPSETIAHDLNQSVDQNSLRGEFKILQNFGGFNGNSEHNQRHQQYSRGPRHQKQSTIYEAAGH
jgi:hypothetical protein